MRRVGLHVHDTELVFDSLEASAAKRDRWRTVARRDVLVHEPRTRAIKLDQHRARAALPGQRDFDSGAVMLQREAVPLAAVQPDVTRRWVARERADRGGDDLLRGNQACGNVR